MRKYRGKVDIIAEILRTATSGAKKTKIMYFANLSYGVLKKYLDETTCIGFLQYSNNRYEVTEKGRTFLEKYDIFSTKYSKLESQLESMKFEKEFLQRMCEPYPARGPKGIATRKYERVSRTRRVVKKEKTGARVVVTH